jgi:histidinol-phosphate phosphatase family protein
MMVDKLPFNESWTLFLDRDGVINERLPGDYVKTPEQFVFTNGACEAIAKLSAVFGLVIVVTNQQGIGKGLYTEQDLARVHEKMLDGVKAAGGRIDGIYFAPQLAAEKSPMRKPGIGMALQAQKDFPAIDFSRAVMIGDSDSDMDFAETAGMHAIWITDHHRKDKNRPYVIAQVPSLSEAAKILL